MTLTKDEIQLALKAYEQWLERCVRACRDDGLQDFSVLNEPGLISKIRRDLIELRLMLREVEAEENRKADTWGAKFGR